MWTPFPCAQHTSHESLIPRLVHEHSKLISTFSRINCLVPESIQILLLRRDWKFQVEVLRDSDSLSKHVMKQNWNFHRERGFKEQLPCLGWGVCMNIFWNCISYSSPFRKPNQVKAHTNQKPKTAKALILVSLV